MASTTCSASPDVEGRLDDRDGARGQRTLSRRAAHPLRATARRVEGKATARHSPGCAGSWSSSTPSRRASGACWASLPRVSTAEGLRQASSSSTASWRAGSASRFAITSTRCSGTLRTAASTSISPFGACRRGCGDCPSTSSSSTRPFSRSAANPGLLPTAVRAGRAAQEHRGAPHRASPGRVPSASLRSAISSRSSAWTTSSASRRPRSGRRSTRASTGAGSGFPGSSPATSSPVGSTGLGTNPTDARSISAIGPRRSLPGSAGRDS